MSEGGSRPGTGLAGGSGDMNPDMEDLYVKYKVNIKLWTFILFFCIQVIAVWCPHFLFGKNLNGL